MMGLKTKQNKTSVGGPMVSTATVVLLGPPFSSPNSAHRLPLTPADSR
jgi:hypothetical protein